MFILQRFNGCIDTIEKLTAEKTSLEKVTIFVCVTHYQSQSTFCPNHQGTNRAYQVHFMGLLFVTTYIWTTVYSLKSFIKINFQVVYARLFFFLGGGGPILSQLIMTVQVNFVLSQLILQWYMSIQKLKLQVAVVQHLKKEIDELNLVSIDQ